MDWGCVEREDKCEIEGIERDGMYWIERDGLVGLDVMGEVCREYVEGWDVLGKCWE